MMWARVVKTGNRVRLYSSEDQKVWTEVERLSLEGDFDISWPIFMEETIETTDVSGQSQAE